MMDKIKKSYKWIAIALTLILVIYIVFGVFSYENRINRLVTFNLSFLNQCIKNNAYNEIYRFKAVKSITPYDSKSNELFIDFYCYGLGLVPSSIYYGFYYTSKNEPKGFQNVYVKFEPDGDGWRWKEPSGDNWQYTKKITDHWYYYEAGF